MRTTRLTFLAGALFSTIVACALVLAPLEAVRADTPKAVAADKSSRKKKKPAKPATLNWNRDSYDPTVPPSAGAELSSLIKAPVQPETGSRKGAESGYAIGEKLRVGTGTAPTPDVRPGQPGGGLRASWLGKDGMAVSGGLGYDADGRSKPFGPSSSGPSENTPPGPAAGVVLKYSF